MLPNLNYDWDYEAFEAMERAELCQSAESKRITQLKKLIKKRTNKSYEIVTYQKELTNLLRINPCLK